MRVELGAGWQLWHLADRNVELRKESAVYRRLTDRDGYVSYRAEPGMDRYTMIQNALNEGIKQDGLMAQRIARQLMPSGRALESYRHEQHRLATAFATPDDAAVIGRMRA